MESSGSDARSHIGRRRSILRHDHLDSSPRVLRETLEALAALLEVCEPRVRRRALLMFGELVAGWQARVSGEPIAAEIEFLPDALRMSFRSSESTLTPEEWDVLVSATVNDLADEWGIDRRTPGSAWFEFRY
jgi:hypothetical protein